MRERVNGLRLVVAAAALWSSATHGQGADDWAVVPSVFDEHLVLVRVGEPSRERLFLLDTAAEHSYISRSLAEQWKFDVQRMPPGRTDGFHTSFVHAPSLRIGEQDVAFGHLWVIDDLERRLSRDHRVDGVLGCDYVRASTLMISHGSEEIRIAPPGAQLDLEQFTHVPLLDGPRPAITASVAFDGVDRIDMPFVLDTGSLMPMTIRSGDPPRATEPLGWITAVGFGGPEEYQLFECETVTFAGAAVESVPVAYSRVRDGADLIGAPVLARCDLVFDLDRGRLFVRPHSRNQPTFLEWKLGVAIETTILNGATRHVIIALDPDGGGIRAGLLAGDAVIAMQGMSPPEYRTSNAEPGREGVDVTIMRDGEEMSVSVVPRLALRSWPTAIRAD